MELCEIAVSSQQSVERGQTRRSAPTCLFNGQTHGSAPTPLNPYNIKFWEFSLSNSHFNGLLMIYSR